KKETEEVHKYTPFFFNFKKKGSKRKGGEELHRQFESARQPTTKRAKAGTKKRTKDRMSMDGTKYVRKVPCKPTAVRTIRSQSIHFGAIALSLSESNEAPSDAAAIEEEGEEDEEDEDEEEKESMNKHKEDDNKSEHKEMKRVESASHLPTYHICTLAHCKNPRCRAISRERRQQNKMRKHEMGTSKKEERETEKEKHDSKGTDDLSIKEIVENYGSHSQSQVQSDSQSILSNVSPATQAVHLEFQSLSFETEKVHIITDNNDIDMLDEEIPLENFIVALQEGNIRIMTEHDKHIEYSTGVKIARHHSMGDRRLLETFTKTRQLHDIAETNEPKTSSFHKSAHSHNSNSSDSGWSRQDSDDA
ncbi:DNA repair protein RAD54, partial [Reticulomyxa filosa]